MASRKWLARFMMVPWWIVWLFILGAGAVFQGRRGRCFQAAAAGWGEIVSIN